MNKLAERLKYLRIIKKWSQQSLGEKINVTQSTIAKWEAGSREPSLDDLLKLSEIFNETTDFLLGKIDL